MAANASSDMLQRSFQQPKDSLAFKVALRPVHKAANACGTHLARPGSAESGIAGKRHRGNHWPEIVSPEALKIYRLFEFLNNVTVYGCHPDETLVEITARPFSQSTIDTWHAEEVAIVSNEHNTAYLPPFPR
jgi:hypothetical protein